MSAPISSSYYEHLVGLNAKLSARGFSAIKIVPADGNMEDEDLLEMVHDGLLPNVIVDNHKANIWAKVFSRLKLRNDISIYDGGEIAWAIRKNNPLLKAELNLFSEKRRVGTNFGSDLRNRYYTDQKIVRRAYAPEDMKRFNEYVEYFWRYGVEYSFDYLMIVAQGYQESNFKQSERSKSGAVGVMQMKPSTASEKAVAIVGIDKSAEKTFRRATSIFDIFLPPPSRTPSSTIKIECDSVLRLITPVLEV